MSEQAFEVLAGSEPVHHPSAVREQPVDASDSVTFTVLLRLPPDAPALPSLAELSARASLGGTVDHSDFSRRYQADPADVAAVEAFATGHGFTVQNVDLPARTIRLSGPVGKIDDAFRVRLHQYRHESETYRSHDEPISIPDDMKSIVKAVFGLSTRRAANRGPASGDRPQRGPTGVETRAEATAKSEAGPGTLGQRPQPQIADDDRKQDGDDGDDDTLPSNGDFPMNIAALYGFPDKAVGTGQSVAIVELGGGFTNETLKTYFETYARVPLPDITAINVGKGTNNPKDANAAEVYLDIAVLGTIASGAKINVYFAENTFQGFLLAVKAAIHDQDNANAIISISWGMPESSVNAAYTDAMNEAMNEAAALGITVCASSGDYGSADSANNASGKAEVNFPASSPFVLSCGGTSVTRKAGGGIASEVVWNSGGQASGGGVSAVFPPPPYQDISVASVNPGAPAGRGVPDVAGCADRDTLGYFVLVDSYPVITVHGGTSAVAPLWAGLFARINETLGRRVGFANPILYGEPARQHCFRDITLGSNAVGTTAGYDAKVGWDACTGLGSPIGTAILSLFEGMQPQS